MIKDSRMLFAKAVFFFWFCLCFLGKKCYYMHVDRAHARRLYLLHKQAFRLILRHIKKETEYESHYQ